MLALDVDSRIDITGDARADPGGTTLKQWVLGYAETISSSEWSGGQRIRWTGPSMLPRSSDDDTFGLMDNDVCRLGL